MNRLDDNWDSCRNSRGGSGGSRTIKPWPVLWQNIVYRSLGGRRTSRCYPIFLADTLDGIGRLERGVEIGAMTAVRQGTKVSQGAMIGMGSVIRKDPPANTLVVGNPPKTLRKLMEF